MKPLLTILVALLIAACGQSSDAGLAETSDTTATEETVCSCVNEPILTDAKANACEDIFSAMTPESIALQTMECRKSVPVPDGGPDLCYCIRAVQPDPEVWAMCEDLLPKDMTPAEISAKYVECAS